MNESKSNIQYSKLISIEYYRINRVDRHFEDFKDLNAFNIQ